MLAMMLTTSTEVIRTIENMHSSPYLMKWGWVKYFTKWIVRTRIITLSSKFVVISFIINKDVRGGSS